MTASVTKRGATVLAVIAATILISPPIEAATILWDQQPTQPVDPSAALINQAFPDFPAFSTFMVNDVVFSTPVVIESVTTYVTTFFGSQGIFPAAGTALLNIFADPLTALSDPTTGVPVPVTLASIGDVIEVTASGLNIGLGPGTYWIGLTPVLELDVYDQLFHLSAALIGSLSQLRNPGEAFGLGTDWFTSDVLLPEFEDASLRITGTAVPEPATLLLVGLALGGGLMTRRARAHRHASVHACAVAEPRQP